MNLRALGTVVVALSVGAVLRAQTPLPQGSARPGPAARGAANSTTSARIRGRVVAADTGKPLRQAQVHLTNSEAQIDQLTTTDQEGTFAFSDLPAGRYSISAAKAGFVTLQLGQRRSFEPGKPLELTAGALVEKTDFSLPRSGVISGRISDENGQPLAGVQVQALRYQYKPDGQRQPAAAGSSAAGPYPLVTDDRGEYRVYDLMPGDYLLKAALRDPSAIGPRDASITTVAQKGGEAGDGYVETYYPGVLDASAAQAISVTAAQEVNASLSLLKTRLFRLSGFVFNSQGNPPRTSMVIMNSSSVFAPTQADGSFSLAGVSQGQHWLRVLTTAAGAGPQPVETGVAEVTVASEDVGNIIIRTDGGSALIGRVVFDGASTRPALGGDSGPDASRFLHASPTVVDRDPTAGVGYSRFDNGQGFVAEDGAFRVTSVRGNLLFRLNGLGTWALKSVTHAGEDITDVPYEVRGTEPIEIEMVITDHLTTVSGAVKDQRGRAMKDYVVVFLPVDLKKGMVPNRFIRSVRPDQNGRYQTKGLPPARYVAVAVPSLEDGGEWDPDFQEEIRPKGKLLSLTDGETLSLDLSLSE